MSRLMAIPTLIGDVKRSLEEAKSSPVDVGSNASVTRGRKRKTDDRPSPEQWIGVNRPSGYVTRQLMQVGSLFSRL